MGAYQYVAVDTGGKEHRGVLEGDTPRHVRQLLRETPAPARRGGRGRGARAQDTAAVLVSARHFGARLGAAHAPARNPRQGRPAARGSAARRQRAHGEAAPQEHRARRARQGARRPLARRRASTTSRTPSRSSTAQPCRPASRRASSTPCSSGWRTTPSRATACAKRCVQAMIYPIVLTVIAAVHRDLDAGLRGPEGRRSVRDHGPGAADAHAGPDRAVEPRCRTGGSCSSPRSCSG